jgi:hypothetical protein
LKIVATYNVEGFGRDVHNVAMFSTRHKFAERFTTEPLLSFMTKPVPAEELETRLVELVPGVSRISTSFFHSMYDLIVVKGTAFDWDEIAPNIVSLLEERDQRLSNVPEEIRALQSLYDAK